MAPRLATTDDLLTDSVSLMAAWENVTRVAMDYRR
jgi:hypothetical protein